MVTGDCPAPTTVYGMPIGAPSQVVPKSGCKVVSRPIEATRTSDSGCTGSAEMSVFQGLSSGKMRQAPTRGEASSAPEVSPSVELSLADASLVDALCVESSLVDALCVESSVSAVDASLVASLAASPSTSLVVPLDR